MNFGDIFLYNEENFVFLVREDDIIFAALILDKEQTQRLDRWRDREFKKSNSRADGQTEFCYVVLTTEAFKERAAHYGNPDKDVDISLDIYDKLDSEDVEKLKNEIIQDNAVMPALKMAVKKYFGIDE